MRPPIVIGEALDERTSDTEKDAVPQVHVDKIIIGCIAKAFGTHNILRYKRMAITFAASAVKHGVPHEDAMYAIANEVYSEDNFSEPRVPGHGKPTLFIGPPRKLGGPLLEVMVEIIPPRDVFVFPVMEARPKILGRMKTDD